MTVRKIAVYGHANREVAGFTGAGIDILMRLRRLPLLLQAAQDIRRYLLASVDIEDQQRLFRIEGNDALAFFRVESELD